LKLKYDEPLSNFAFNFNWHRYKEEELGAIATARSDFSVREEELAVGTDG